MYCHVAHGAGLIFLRLIVRGPGRSLGRESVALQAEQIDLAHAQQPRVGRTVGSVAAAAALGLHRHMLIDEGPLLVGVALVANRVATGQRPHLPDGSGAVHVMTVTALN